MLFDDDDKMYDGPVAYDGEEGLQGVREEGGCATADCYGGDETECHEGDAGNAEGPWPEILGMESEGVVVWDVVLGRLVFLLSCCIVCVTYWNRAQSREDE